ncbi:MAG: DUF4010 domain-containing protein [Rhodococcus sp. (in: high G+C Gram-positive bacteria)]|nr:MAG: DUF4010 domain-containing protein [Rhodococcus sp. (in: high G+C Gram-positive bacteria)]
MDPTELHLLGYAAALLIGLGLGIEREHNAGADHAVDATTPVPPPGARTFPLIAVTGAVAAHLGTVVVAVGFIGVSLLILLWYWVRTHTGPDPDVGTTTSVAALTAYLLGALAWHQPSLAVAVGVAVFALLAVKYPIHEFAQRMIDERDIVDFCVLLAIAFLLLPLLPDRDMGPYGALNPATVGTLVLLLTLIGWAGYVATRLLGPRWGLLIVGFGGGFVSATATTAVIARTARTHPRARDTLPAALIANIATLLLVVAITRVVDTAVSTALALVFAGAALLLAGEVAFLVYRNRSADRGGRPGTDRPGNHGREDAERADDGDEAGEAPSTGLLERPISVQATLLVVAVLVILLIATRGAADVLGSRGAILAAGVGGLADAHSPALSAAAAVGETLSAQAATVAAATAVGTNLVVKVTLAALVGTPAFALRLAAWLIPPVAVSVAALWIVVT